MKNKIFFFTGTGNSLQVANDLANIIVNCEIINIADFDLSTNIEAERIGIVFPVYFWGLPLIVQRFISHIQISKSSYVFLVATYGLWPGKALELADDILKHRDISLDAGFFIKMPDNYILWYGAKSQDVQNKCFEREKVKVKFIGEFLISKENLPIEKSRYFIDRLLTRPINKLSVKRFASTSRKFTADEKCVCCGLCEKICPAMNIKLSESRPVWGDHCEACLGCIQRCPTQAINYNHKTESRKRYINPNVKF